jgi:hypothetical protein
MRISQYEFDERGSPVVLLELVYGREIFRATRRFCNYVESLRFRLETGLGSHNEALGRFRVATARALPYYGNNSTTSV